MSRRRVARGRTAWAAILLLCGAAALAQESAAPVSVEEAAEFARRAAAAALHGPRKLFVETINADGILRRLLGANVWGGLTRRQQDILRTTVRDHVYEALVPPAGASSEVRWAWVPETADADVPVSMGLHYGAATLKTRWMLSHTPRGWVIDDIVLVDPGLSLADEAGQLLGPHPAIARDRVRDARVRILPRLAGLLAVLAAAFLFARRLPRERRPLLWLTASVPAVLFLIDGSLAARRALKEPYALADTLPAQAWRDAEKSALQHQREGNIEKSRVAWEKALDEGAPRAPVYYQMGLFARASGDSAQAQRDFEMALAEQPPAPGSGKELALMALAEGRNADARARLANYLEQTGPDPDTLASLAVIETNLGNSDAAVAALNSARALVGDSSRRAELEAQIYARAGNAEATVEALRPLERQGRLDRYALRTDPAFIRIATEPAWVAFLSEPPSVVPTP